MTHHAGHHDTPVQHDTPDRHDPRRGGPARVKVAVHGGRCQHYGICQQEAPEVFALRSPTRLTYDTTPAAQDTAAVHQAARLCPAQAITVDPA